MLYFSFRESSRHKHKCPLSGSKVTKVAMRNGMNGEFTRVNCEIKERVHQGVKRNGASWPVACVNRQRRLPVYGA